MLYFILFLFLFPFLFFLAPVYSSYFPSVSLRLSFPCARKRLFVLFCCSLRRSLLAPRFVSARKSFSFLIYFLSSLRLLPRARRTVCLLSLRHSHAYTHHCSSQNISRHSFQKLTNCCLIFHLKSYRNSAHF